MHRNASHFSTRCISTFGRIVQGRRSSLLAKAGSGHAVADDGPVIEDSLSWEETHGRLVGRRPVNTRGVIVDDLTGTLEAHRADNRAAVIRKIIPNRDLEPNPFLRLSLQGSRQAVRSANKELPTDNRIKGEKRRGNEKTDQTNRTVKGIEDKVGAPVWPADSIQAGSRNGRRGRSDYIKSDESLEYTGRPFGLNPSWQLKPNTATWLQRPWLAYLQESNGNSLSRLSDEIRAYEAYMRLTPDEGDVVRNVIADIRSATGDSLQDMTTIGSHKTGLATPFSDIDLAFTSPPARQRSSAFSRRHSRTKMMKAVVKSLRKVYNLLRASKTLYNTELVIARVPIVRTQHRATTLKIEIQIMESFKPAQEYTATYLNELPSLRPLYILLRYSLELRGLTTVFQGGLGSYPLMMMVVTALKHSSGTFDPNDLAGQLLYILHFYGSADLYKSGFSANPPRVFDNVKGGRSMEKTTARSQVAQLQGIDEIVNNRNPRKPYLLSLQDPANDSNDLGKNAYAIKHIQATFIKARENILNALHRWEKAEKRDELSALNYLVRANYRVFEAHRSRLERSKNPRMSGNHDYSEGRLEEDFMRRVEYYKKMTENRGTDTTS